MSDSLSPSEGRIFQVCPVDLWLHVTDQNLSRGHPQTKQQPRGMR